jgi:hypothetical protein
MHCDFLPADSGRLVCRLTDADGEHYLGASSREDAAQELGDALDDLEKNGTGECYWCDDASEYRWVFKRDGDLVKVAVLRLTGVVPGYQHVAWVEEEAAELVGSLRAALGGVH